MATRVYRLENDGSTVDITSQARSTSEITTTTCTPTLQRTFDSNTFRDFLVSLHICNKNKNPILATGRAERLQQDLERGLRVLSRSRGLTDFSVLESAYPEESTQWKVLINELRAIVETQKKGNIPELDILVNVCNHMNDWFTKHDLVLFVSYPKESERKTNGSLGCLGLGQIADRIQYEFKGKQIPLYFEWALANQSAFSELGRHHDGRMITLNLSMLTHSATCPWDPKYTTDFPNDVLLANGFIPQLYRAQTKLIREIRDKNNPEELLIKTVGATAIEELRHWTDYVTVQEESKREYSIFDLSQYDYFGKTQTLGVLNQLNQTAGLGFLTYELAGRLTRGAFGHLSKENLIGHIRFLANTKHRSSSEFGIGMLYVRILGDELQLTRAKDRLSPSNWKGMEARDLYNLIDGLVDISEEQYGSSCQSVLEKNYKYPNHNGFFHT